MSSFLIVGPEWRTLPIQSSFPSDHTLTCSTDVPDILTLSTFDFFITCGYEKRILPEVLNLFNDKSCLNIHATFLPFGRGIGTAMFSLLYPVSLGSSIHILRPKIDTGEIIYQEPLVLSSSIKTQRQLYHFWVQHAADLFLKNIDSISRHNFLLKPQTSEYITPYLSRDDSELVLSLLPLRWDSTLPQIRNLSHVLAFKNTYNLLSDEFF